MMLLAIILGARQFEEIKQLANKQWGQLMIIGAVGGSVPFLLFFKGLQMTTGTTSSFIQKTIFVYACVFALVFLKEKISKSIFIGSALLLAGTYFMVKPTFVLSIGHLLVLIATIMWAAEYTYAKHVLKHVSGTTVAFGRMFFGSIIIFLYLLMTGKADIMLHITSSQMIWILISSVLLLLYVFTFYNGLKQISVGAATGMLTLGAPITSLLGYLFQGKTFGIPEATGIILILAGTAVIAFFTLRMSRLAIQEVAHERH